MYLASSLRQTSRSWWGAGKLRHLAAAFYQQNEVSKSVEDRTLSLLFTQFCTTAARHSRSTVFRQPFSDFPSKQIAAKGLLFSAPRTDGLFQATMAGRRPEFEDRSEVKRQKRGIELTKNSSHEEESTSESADEEDGGVPVPRYQLAKPANVGGQVSDYYTECYCSFPHYPLKHVQSALKLCKSAENTFEIHIALKLPKGGYTEY